MKYSPANFDGLPRNSWPFSAVRQQLGLADSGKTRVGDIHVRNSIFVNMIKHNIWILTWKNYPYALINQSQVNNVYATSNYWYISYWAIGFKSNQPMQTFVLIFISNLISMMAVSFTAWPISCSALWIKLAYHVMWFNQNETRIWNYPTHIHNLCAPPCENWRVVLTAIEW